VLALQGFGGGGLMTLAQAVIGEVVSPKERGRFSGMDRNQFLLLLAKLLILDTACGEDRPIAPNVDTAPIIWLLVAKSKGKKKRRSTIRGLSAEAERRMSFDRLHTRFSDCWRRARTHF
jgi:hypothetical protein